MSLEFICSAYDRELACPRGTTGTWAQAHDGTTGHPMDYSTFFSVGCYETTGSYQMRGRGFVDFDLSDLPANWASVYETVKLRLYIETWNGGSGDAGDIVIVQGVQNLPVEDDDYGAQLPYVTSGGVGDKDDWSEAGWFDIELNVAGKALITAGETLKLCLKTLADVNNNPIFNGEYRTYIWTRDAGVAKAARLLFETVYPSYPSHDLTRVTGIRHIYRPGSYRLEATLGEVSTSIELPQRDIQIPTIVPVGSTKIPKPPKTTSLRVPDRTAPEIIEVLKEEGIFGASADVTATEPLEIRAGILERVQPVTEEDIEEIRRRLAPETNIWQKLTPWKEERGETIGSAVGELFRRIFGSVFGG